MNWGVCACAQFSPERQQQKQHLGLVENALSGLTTELWNQKLTSRDPWAMCVQLKLRRTAG